MWKVSRLSYCQTRTYTLWQALAGMEDTIGLRSRGLSCSDSSGSWAKMLGSTTTLCSTWILSLPGTMFGGTKGTWLGASTLRSTSGIQIIIHRCLLAQLQGLQEHHLAVHRAPLPLASSPLLASLLARSESGSASLSAGSLAAQAKLLQWHPAQPQLPQQHRPVPHRWHPTTP